MDAVVFQIGKRRCALELHHVEEVIRLGPVTPVPAGPGAAVGAMNVRGEVVAVLDAHALVGEPSPGTVGGVGLLAQAEGCRVVLCVDRVEGVLPDEELDRCSASGDPPLPLRLPELLRSLIGQLREAGRRWQDSAPELNPAQQPPGEVDREEP